MSALAKVLEAEDPYPFETRVGGQGEWIVRGPNDRCGGLFVSLEAAQDFVRRERRAMIAEAERRKSRPTLTLVRSQDAVFGERPPVTRNPDPTLQEFRRSRKTP